MAIGPDSRYNRAPVLIVRDQFGRLERTPYHDLLQRYEDIDDPTNRRIRVQDHDDWHTLGYRNLGSSRHAWAIMDFNKIVNPFEELETGRSIIIPSRETFQFDVLDFEVDVEQLETGEA